MIHYIYIFVIHVIATVYSFKRFYFCIERNVRYVIFQNSHFKEVLTTHTEIFLVDEKPIFFFFFMLLLVITYYTIYYDLGRIIIFYI